jgi:hypothetical protein
MDSILLSHIGKIFSYASHADFSSCATLNDKDVQYCLYYAIAKSSESHAIAMNHPRKEKPPSPPSPKSTIRRNMSYDDSPVSIFDRII